MVGGKTAAPDDGGNAIGEPFGERGIVAITPPNLPQQQQQSKSYPIEQSRLHESNDVIIFY